ncbi:unnamed protein product [Onchocerca flexuosa]|uniref:Superoxide dismutase n=1 Tax=Onchocerca flexuosa TaxID=387005 RepID=A0A183I448_9BILA|nr:unnamed protein product [Onchocerca flexuosa]
MTAECLASTSATSLSLHITLSIPAIGSLQVRVRLAYVIDESDYWHRRSLIGWQEWTLFENLCRIIVENCFEPNRFDIYSYGLNIQRLKHVLPDLPYDYGALEPVLSAEIMQVHHGKHHAAYVNALNQAEEKVKEALAKGDTQAAVAGTKLMNFNTGGHINHTLFWEGLTAVKDSGEPNSELMTAIKKDFGSLETMIDKLNAKTIAIQGSGWGWLAYDKEMKRLQLACCPNQDLLEPTTGK